MVYDRSWYRYQSLSFWSYALLTLRNDTSSNRHSKLKLRSSTNHHMISPTRIVTIRSDQNLLLANRDLETALRHFCIGVRHFATLDRVGRKAFESIRWSAGNLDQLPLAFN